MPESPFNKLIALQVELTALLNELADLPDIELYSQREALYNSKALMKATAKLNLRIINSWNKSLPQLQKPRTASSPTVEIKLFDPEAMDRRFVEPEEDLPANDLDQWRNAFGH